MTIIKFGEKKFKWASDMIKTGLAAGYKHTGGVSFACKHCKDRASVRKFTKGDEVVYCCHKCSAYW